MPTKVKGMKKRGKKKAANSVPKVKGNKTLTPSKARKR